MQGEACELQQQPHLVCTQPTPLKINQVTFVEAMPNIMPGFDKEIARLAERVLIKPRSIDYVTGVIASKVTPGVPGAWCDLGRDLGGRDGVIWGVAGDLEGSVDGIVRAVCVCKEERKRD
jgi:hypothetical protein